MLIYEFVEICSTPLTTAQRRGLLLYVREHIPSKLLDDKGITLDKDFECLFIEINLHGKKWLIVGIYNPSKLLLGKNLNDLLLHIHWYVHKYDNLFIMGDFNSDPYEIEFKKSCT